MIPPGADKFVCFLILSLCLLGFLLAGLVLGGLIFILG